MIVFYLRFINGTSATKPGPVLGPFRFVVIHMDSIMGGNKLDEMKRIAFIKALFWRIDKSIPPHDEGDTWSDIRVEVKNG